MSFPPTYLSITEEILIEPKKKGLSFKVISPDTAPLSQISQYFADFKLAHFISAGRSTRSDESWEIMKQLLLTSQAKLFLVSLCDKAISYLFCGEYLQSCFGWTQVNIDEYETKYSPRHYLEWNAILYYKEKGFLCYELGDIYMTSQAFKQPTSKELSISTFKERFGGRLVPKLYWNLNTL